MYSEKIEEFRNYFQSHNKHKEYSGHSSKVHSVGWSCDGKRLASGSFDKCVCIYTLDKDRLNKEITFKGHGGSVDQLCWHQTHPDLLSTASGDKSVRIWDSRVQKCVATIPTKGENINITWAPNGDTIAVGNKEDLVTFIDARTHRIKSEEQYNFEVNEISWNNSSDLFFLTNGQGCIHILSYPDLELQHILNAHPGTCICIEFDPTGKYFATGSADALVSLWDVDELACKKVFTRMDWPVRTISFSHDGQLLASASEDLIIDIGFTETGDKIADISVDAATFTVAWHPSQYLLAYACDDKDTYDPFLQSSAFPSKKPVGRVNSEQDVDRIRENMILNPKISHRTQCWWSAYRAGGFTVEEGLVITGRQHTRGKYLGERAEIANVWCGRKYKYEGLVSGIVLPTFCKRSRCKSTSTSEPATKI